MNERIFELAEQAENYATTRHPVSNIALYLNSEKFVKKFAELIVKECAQFVEDKFDFIGEEIIVKERMLEHFGVEE